MPAFAFPNSLLTDSKKLNSRRSFIFIVSLHELFMWSSVEAPPLGPLAILAELTDASLGLIPIIILDGWELVLIDAYLAAGVSAACFYSTDSIAADAPSFDALTWLDWPILIPLPWRVILTLGLACPPMTISSLFSLIVLFWLSEIS